MYLKFKMADNYEGNGRTRTPKSSCLQQYHATYQIKAISKENSNIILNH